MSSSCAGHDLQKKGELQHHGRQFKLEQRSNVDWTHGKAVGGVHIFRQLMTCPGMYVGSLLPVLSLLLEIHELHIYTHLCISGEGSDETRLA